VDELHNTVAVLKTDVGMCGLWRPEAFVFRDADDWEDWAAENSRIEESIRAGAFVPLNVGGDGAFQVCLRYGTTSPTLTDEERQYVIVASQPYLLLSNGAIVMGGIEDVGEKGIPEGRRIALAPGRYSVVVHLIDWKAAPNAIGPDGRPSASALPDFVVLAAEESTGSARYRQSVDTFERPR
jgi:hypothetical protein